MTEVHKPAILVVDDHVGTLTTLRALFKRQGWDVTTASSGLDGLARMTDAPPDLALVDLNMDDLDGLSLLDRARASKVDTPCVMISAENSVPAAVEAMRLGARDFLVKPLDPKLLVNRVREALGGHGRGDGGDPRALWRDRHAPGLIGCDERLLEVFRVLDHIAPTDCTVLIQGESGTGKELVARAIHSASARSDAPFVPVNCAAIPDTLIEAELFGSRRGAYSGADQDREGWFAAADGGTLFLDEIGEMSPAAQAKVLRVLQNCEFTPVGANRPRQVDVRVIAASNRKLADHEHFREDLYYRLNQIPVMLPPLREREADIPLLAEYFVRRAATRFGREPPVLLPATIDTLSRYRWPGNVRELEHVIDQLVLLNRSSSPVGVESLPEQITANLVSRAAASIASGTFELPDEGIDLRAFLARVESLLIEEALAKSSGNRSQAARLLRLNRTTLVEKLRRQRGERSD